MMFSIVDLLIPRCLWAADAETNTATIDPSSLIWCTHFERAADSSAFVSPESLRPFNDREMIDLVSSEWPGRSRMVERAHDRRPSPGTVELGRRPDRIADM